LFQMSSMQSEVSAAFLGLDSAGVIAAQTMSTYLLYRGQPAGRSRYVENNTYGAQGLWAMGISGDLPAITAVFSSLNHIRLASSLLRMQDYLRRLGLWFDLIFIADEDAGYSQPVRDALREAIAGSPARDRYCRPSGVYLIEKRGLASESQYDLLLAFASFIFYGSQGTAASQLSRMKPRQEHLAQSAKPEPVVQNARVGRRNKAGIHKRRPNSRLAASAESLAAHDAAHVDVYANVPIKQQTVFGNNGYGGYDSDDSYIIQPGAVPPAPWCNVIANPNIGAVWTDRGAAFMWAGNSGLGRMTEFNNDCLRGSSNEAIFIRDEITRAYCTPTPYPRGGSVKVRHSQGYSVYESNQLGLAIKLTVFADIENPVICRWLVIKNVGDLPRRVSITPFTLWSYGNEDETRLLQTGLSDNTVWARHPGSGRTLFQTILGDALSIKSSTTDAITFLGLNGIENPRAMECPELDDFAVRGASPNLEKSGGLPCAAMTAVVEIAPFAEVSVCILTGVL